MTLIAWYLFWSAVSAGIDRATAGIRRDKAYPPILICQRIFDRLFLAMLFKQVIKRLDRQGV
jgi:hypothetical protein